MRSETGNLFGEQNVHQPIPIFHHKPTNLTFAEPDLVVSRRPGTVNPIENHPRNVSCCMHSLCRRQGKSHTTETMAGQGI
jgi:hypothetical protein